MEQALWTPPSARVKPNVRKDEGGSSFDDELELQARHDEKLKEEATRLVAHLNERPDHTVYVGSTEERSKMRDVFNNWIKFGLIGHNPNIRIDYGIAEGGIRVDE